TAIVEALSDAGAATAVTTHYETLKAMGVTDPRARNASVGFDVKTMRPSFELTLDVPGSSSALVVAERFGIPHAVIERAERALPEETRNFEALVAKLSEARAEHDEQARALDAERRAHAEARTVLEREIEKLRARESKQLSDEGARLAKRIRDAQAEVRAVRRELREARTEAAAEAARSKLEAIE